MIALHRSLKFEYRTGFAYWQSHFPYLNIPQHKPRYDTIPPKASVTNILFPEDANEEKRGGKVGNH
jgi:hypothetical protein